MLKQAKDETRKLLVDKKDLRARLGLVADIERAFLLECVRVACHEARAQSEAEGAAPVTI
jgi:hypothetical protein